MKNLDPEKFQSYEDWKDKYLVMPMFTTQHYNAIAKEIRELFPLDPAEEFIDQATRTMLMDQRAILSTLALNLCCRFKEDNPIFDPIKFLDQCSPNTDFYPLSELWEEDDG